MVLVVGFILVGRFAFGGDLVCMIGLDFGVLDLAGVVLWFDLGFLGFGFVCGLCNMVFVVFGGDRWRLVVL